MSGHKSGELSGKSSAGTPVHPLVDLGTFGGIGAKEGSAVSEEFSDSARFVDAAFGGLEHGEFTSHVLGLVISRLDSFSINNFDVDLLVGHAGDNLAAHAEEVERVVKVEIL